MDVFDLTPAARAFYRAAAVQAGHRLRIFAALREPQTCATIAARLSLPPRRLRALLDVLALEGWLRRSSAHADVAFVCDTLPAEGPALPRAGPGLLDDVLRNDRPLPEPGVLGTSSDALARFHAHLEAGGVESARELAGLLAPRLPPQARILDLGSGTGTWSAAVAARMPGAHVTLADRPDVLALVGPGEPVSRLAVDLLNGGYPVDQSLVLLANVLHLFGPEDCASIAGHAARALAPGGLLVVKDLRIEADRSGPAASLYFALTMALFTEAGTVHGADAIEGWLRAAGLSRIERLALGTSPDAWAFAASA